MRGKSQSVEIIQNKRDWSKVIANLIKYNRRSSLYANSIGFSYLIEQIVKKGHIVRLNIPDTLTGEHDNYLKTQF